MFYCGITNKCPWSAYHVQETESWTQTSLQYKEYEQRLPASSALIVYMLLNSCTAGARKTQIFDAAGSFLIN